MPFRKKEKKMEIINESDFSDRLPHPICNKDTNIIGWGCIICDPVDHTVMYSPKQIFKDRDQVFRHLIDNHGIKK